MLERRSVRSRTCTALGSAPAGGLPGVGRVRTLSFALYGSEMTGSTPLEIVELRWSPRGFHLGYIPVSKPIKGGGRERATVLLCDAGLEGLFGSVPCKPLFLKGIEKSQAPAHFCIDDS